MLSVLENNTSNKMLYIFHVDIGSMMTFEMESALHTVGQLKDRIFLAKGIPPEKQVLVVSGGACLCSEQKVCSYSGGTDTNPIFLFSKLDIDDDLLLPEESVISRSDSDLLGKVQQSITESTVTCKIVQQRASLAQQLYDIAVEYHTHCKKLVHDQHLQQQGWMAVVANLEDITAEFKQRADLFQETFNVYFSSYDDYKRLVEGYHDDLKLLASTPLLPALLLHDKSIAKEGEELSPLGQLFADPTATVSLLDFMTSWENDKPFQQLFDYCTKGLEQFDSKVSDRMQTEINEVLAMANDADMKEVKGIGERLFGLEKLIIEALDLVKEQQDQSNAFNANNSKVLRTGDKSILPDLCNSHTLQLQSMAQTHQKMCDIRRRCIRAKEELIKNLFVRLKWIMYVENKILEANQKLFVCHENLKRLCRQLDILQQIHKAPSVYLSSLAEVVRRRKFSEGFLWWASDIACRLLTIYNDESQRRKDFRAATEGHFLNVLFPGMEDMPPAFAIQAPSMFDSSLPPISEDDIRNLIGSLPEALRNELKIADISATLDFFAVREIRSENDEGGSENRTLEATVVSTNEDDVKPRESEACLGAAALSLLRDLDKGCESETDTEEFEKLCQSPLELQFVKDEVTSAASSSERKKMQDAATLTEDNLQSSRMEYDQLRGTLTEVSSRTHQTICKLRMAMVDLKDYFELERISIEKHYEGLSESWEQVTNDNEVKTQQMSRLTIDHEELLRHVKTELDLKSEQIKSLHDENALLEQKLKDHYIENSHLKNEIDRLNENNQVELSKLLRTIEEKDAEKERAVETTKEEIIRKHNVELENMRSRFRLLERIPSESAIEKQQQVLAEIESQRADAIERAVLSERARWESISENSTSRHQSLVQDNEQKDVLISTLLKEIEQLRKTHKDVATDVVEISADLKRGDDLGASVVVAATDSKTDAATSPIKCKDKLTGSQLLLIKSNKLSISSCNPGDLVLVIWEPKLQNFKILQESVAVYFLHSDCLTSLGLKKGDDSRTYCVGQVVHKDYCQARKSQNRYNVPIGTRFYRVTVKPVGHVHTDPSKEASETTTGEGGSGLQSMSESHRQRSSSGDGAFLESGPSSTPTSLIESSNVVTDESAMAHSTPESMPNLMDTSSSNRTHTFTYVLSDPWNVGSAWILENS